MSELNIVDIIGRRIVIQPVGYGRYWGICPFHKDKRNKSYFVIETPSMLVDKEAGTFRCFKCNEHGGAQEFLNKFECKG